MLYGQDKSNQRVLEQYNNIGKADQRVQAYF